MANSLTEFLAQLNKRPTLAASVTDDNHLLDRVRIAFYSGSDIIELRFDTFSSKSRRNAASLVSGLRQRIQLPIIATVRSATEQDPKRTSFNLNNSARLKLYQTVLPYVDFIDVELASDKINRTLVKTAHGMGKKVILSYHNFISTPNKEQVDAMVHKFKKLGGDILKVAAMPEKEKDVNKLMRMCRNLSNIRRIFIAMGPLGSVSRIKGFSYGSCITYGYLGKASAPGQLSVKELVKHWKKYYPTFMG